MPTFELFTESNSLKRQKRRKQLYCVYQGQMRGGTQDMMT